MWTRRTLIACALLALVSPRSGDRPEFPERVPGGLTGPIPAPKDNPMRKAVFDLGRDLFFDPVLSVDHKTSCASCHEPAHAFASSTALPAGSLGKHALRNAPSLFNRAWGKTQSWDGRIATLEEQVLAPIADPNEMALPVADAVARLRESATWKRRFERVFGAAPSRERLAHALACFVRGLVSGDSRVDRFQAGDREKLDKRERRGLWLYESKGGCWKCHSGPNLTDESFHNTGVGSMGGRIATGRFVVTGKEEDRGAFKTPTLRNVALTAPYMHDGSIETLAGVVEFYRRGGNANTNLSRKVERLDITDDDAAALVAFLRALTGSSGKPK